MDVGDTQLIDDSPPPSPSRSSMSGESTGSDGPLHEPTQLLYAQLLDQYQGRMDSAHKTQQLGLDMETQLLDEHNFDDFRKNEGMIIPSEDEASKETQLVHGGEVHSGSSSGKDGEVDSALSPLSAAFHEKTPWLSEFTHRDRSIEGAAGRTPQVTFPYRDKYLGETQILSDDENGEAHDNLAKEQRNFANTRAVVTGCPDLHNRDGDVPPFLRDFDPNRRDYAGQRMVGSWHEVVGQSDGCNEDDRGWESAVRGLQLVDSDASTEDEVENHRNSVFNADISYPGEGQSTQHVNSRLTTHVSSNFCNQDLNKSPEPENGMDEWDDGNRVDLGLGNINEGGSNVGQFNRVEQVDLGRPLQSTPIGSGTNEGLNETTVRSTISTSRTAGSIRTASLRASALQASSCCSSEGYRRCTPQGSKSEEVEKAEREATIETLSDLPQKAGGSSGDTTSMSRLSVDRGGPSSTASFLSVLSSRNRVTDSPKVENKVPGAEKILDYSDAETKKVSKIDTWRQGKAASVLGLEVSESGEQNRSRAKKLFVGNGNERDKDAQSSEEETVEAQSGPSSETVDVGKRKEAEPLPLRENRSSPGEKTLERRSSFGSGLFSMGSDMSYLNVHSPGDDSQARALNMVDKLVWLNAIGLPQELQLEEVKVPARGPPNSKSVLQSRVQVAEAKAAMDDPFGVFDWVDSHNDEAGIFYGGGSSKANAVKGASKPANATGQPNLNGLGIKKGAILDVVGSRCKKVEKLPEKEKGVTLNPNTDKLKDMVSKTLSVVVENKREPQEGRPGSRPGATNIRQEPAHIERALSMEESHQDWEGNVTDRRPGIVDKGLTTLGTMDNPLTAGKVQLLSTAKGPHQERNKNPAKQAKLERLSSDTGREHREEAAKASKNLSKTLDVKKGKGDRNVEKKAGEHERTHKERQPSGQSRSNFSPKGFGDSTGTIASEDPDGTEHHLLQETRSLDNEMNEGGCKYDVGDSDSSPQILRNNRIHRTEDKVERGHTTLDKVGCSISVQGDTNGKPESYARVGREGKLSEVSPEKSTTYGKILDNASDPTNLPEGLQQQNYTYTVEGTLSEGVGKYPESSKNTPNGSKVQIIVDYNGIKRSGHLDGSSLAEQSDHRDVLTLSPMQDAHIGPDVNMVTEKRIDFLKTNPTTISREGVAREDRNEDVAPTSEILSSRNDVDGERTPKTEEEMYSVSTKGQIATRRGRSQTRYSSKQVENADPKGRSSNLIRPEKGRGRRVTWAGPLEQVPRQSRGPRSRRNLRVQNEGRGEDVADSTADSSGQEDEAVDIKTDTRSENGTRKRTSEALEMIVSRDNDLDKIKKRFNMSDAAVARLLGTDEEEEDAEPNQAKAVKVRSLSLIQPEADGSEGAAPPSFRRIGKGLRSARNRSEERGRRPRTFASTDQVKLDEDEVVLSFDENVLEENIDGTTMVEAHPSDNEVSGRRRMRSIADVSFPNFPQTTPGRPPVARGLRRRRGRHFVKAPPEPRAEFTDDDLTDVPPCAPPSISPLIGRIRGKGGPRSVRKRKERESEPVPATSEVSLTTNSSREMSPTAFKRRKQTAITSVLLSHGLHEDIIKQQRKIVAKLGGRVAASSSECSHFVADKFVRTGNMLEAMASGKPVVNIQWLETCYLANRFVDEEEFILQDTQKEEEMGFSMIATLSAARQRPLLQGIRVFMTPGTSPGPDSLARIVKSAGGQVVDGYFGPAADGEQESDFCVVISSEEELDDCIPLLEQGAKIYTPEFLLSGVTNYHLDFSNDQLFKNFTTRRRRGSSSRRNMV